MKLDLGSLKLKLELGDELWIELPNGATIAVSTYDKECCLQVFEKEQTYISNELYFIKKSGKLKRD